MGSSTKPQLATLKQNYFVMLEQRRGLQAQDVSMQALALLQTTFNELETLYGMLDAQAAELERAHAENRSKAEFLAMLSHELRTPLNAVMGYAELLANGVPERLPARSLEHVERIRISSLHQLQLVNQIIHYARLETPIETVVRERVDISTLIADVIGLVAPTVQRKNLDIDVQCAVPALVLHTDSSRLRQILVNLLWNAVKFTDHGRILMRVVADAKTVAITVADTGPGIAPEKLPHIFEPFWQGDIRALTDGVGLGLTICRKLARMLGGDVTVDSTEGIGSSFTLELPLD